MTTNNTPLEPTGTKPTNKGYAVTVAFNQVFFLDAESKEIAEELAMEQMEDEYGLAPGQAYVDAIEELK